MLMYLNKLLFNGRQVNIRARLICQHNLTPVGSYDTGEE